MAGLTGMKEITEYANLGEKVIRQLISTEGFPASKACGQWLSDTELIDRWRLRYVEGKTKMEEAGTL